MRDVPRIGQPKGPGMEENGLAGECCGTSTPSAVESVRLSAICNYNAGAGEIARKIRPRSFTLSQNVADLLQSTRSRDQSAKFALRGVRRASILCETHI